MDINDMQKAEYEILFYSLSLKKIIKTIREEIEEILSSSVSSLFNILKSKYKQVNDQDLKQIQDEQMNFKKHLLEKFYPIMENLKEQILNNLDIPSNVLLPGDEIYLEQTSEEEEQNLKIEISILEDQITMLKYQIAKCKNQRHKFEELDKFLNGLQVSSQANYKEDFDSEGFLNLLKNLKLLEKKCFDDSDINESLSSKKVAE